MAKVEEVKGNMHIALLAIRNGYRTWTQLWDQNPDLKGKRKNPFQLFHGDVCRAAKGWAKGDEVQVPPLAAKKEAGAVDATHDFQAGELQVYLTLRVLDEQLNPLQNATYELQIDGRKHRTDDADLEFSVSADGLVEFFPCLDFTVLQRAQTATLIVRLPPPSNGQPKPRADAPQPAAAPLEVVFNLQIGRLNPIDGLAPDEKCVPGVQQRLNNLGFEAGPVNGDDKDPTTGAVRRFQRRFKLKSDNGQIDAELRSALASFHDKPGAAPDPAS